ncbi:MAG TPA: vWA domain-containing protein, partial [Thermodesulfobacteriota bacterium]|nr:vWA domain-containing protein [Thermodesulfobacteriota bacterium]
MEILKNAGLDAAAFTVQLQRGDYLGALQTLGHMMTLIPEAFANFILDEYGFNVSTSQISSFGTILNKGLPVIGALPVLIDLFRKPQSAEIIVRAVGANGGNVDVVLLIDSSPSMYSGCNCPPDNPNGEDRIGPAKEAAKTFIDLMKLGDQVGVVSFGGYSQVRYNLGTVNETTKADAKAAVNNIAEISSTSIGAGLEKALSEFLNRGNALHSHAIILISDGYENTSPYANSILPGIKEAGIAIYSIGLGDTADAALMQHLATETGGTYSFAPSPQDLSVIYNRLAGKVAGQQQVTSGQGSILPGQTDIYEALIGTREATFTITWANPEFDIDLTLTSPSGRVIDQNVAEIDPAIEYVEESSYEFYRIVTPETGVWALQVNNPCLTQSDITYNYTVNESTDLKLDGYANADLVLPGEPIVIVNVASRVPINAS